MRRYNNINRGPHLGSSGNDGAAAHKYGQCVDGGGLREREREEEIVTP